MPLTAGTKLGVYEIVSPIGAGGMGEVYRARDTKLDRDVAIKVLPEEFASHDERLARFEREAKLLASLNHPNIASIYGLEDSDGIKALVLELVEGPTLAERIEQGPIPIDETIAIARQIAAALEAGHEAGVIHRDVKPANVKLKEDGTVKVLDYGLAKALEGDVTNDADSALSHSPTLTRHGTHVGVILGTAAYMSPEQAKGKRVDRRTDVWAFGAVVYEMLTGKRAFQGEDVSDTLAAVLRAEPNFGVLPTDTPEALRATLRLCLTKDTKERVQAIGDVRLAMGGAFATPSTSRAPAPKRFSGASAASLFIGAVVAGTIVWSFVRPEPVEKPLARFQLSFPVDGALRFWPIVGISPDGRRVVWKGDPELNVRSLDETEPRVLEGIRGISPTFSPDGEWIAFADGEELRKVSVQGGLPVTLATIATSATRSLGSGGFVWGVSWSSDDTIVFGRGPSGIHRVSADGGMPELLIPVEAPREAHGPQVLPDGNYVLFTSSQPASWDEAEIVVHSLDTGESKVVIERGRDARYAPTGHLVYVLDGTLMAVAFDPDRLEVTGGPVPLVASVRTAGLLSGAAHFDFSDTGTLIYVRDSGRQAERTLVWVDRQGAEEEVRAPARAYVYPRISPDGSRVAVDVLDQKDNDIWIWDFARESLTRFTFDPGQDNYPTWTPDGKRLAFESKRNGSGNLYWKSADGTGQAGRLTESDRNQSPFAFTPDGTGLLFREWDPRVAGINMDVFMLTLEGAEGEGEPLFASDFSEENAAISPDGRWVAYQSEESGRPEVYVRPFPDVEEGRWQISTNGGGTPVWAPDGRELYYVRWGDRHQEDWRGALMSVRVTTEAGFSPASPEVMFEGSYFTLRGRTYDISPDGQRFLMIKEDPAPLELILVQNWFEELKRLVPTD